MISFLLPRILILTVALVEKSLDQTKFELNDVYSIQGPQPMAAKKIG